MIHQSHVNEFVRWFGNYHPVFLHYPIVLIFMAALAEAFYFLTKKEQYAFTNKFLLVSACVFVLPTVLSGLCFEQLMHFEQNELIIIWWHKFFGGGTLVFTFITTILLLYYGRIRLYYLSLVIALASALTASYLGGLLTWGN